MITQHGTRQHNGIQTQERAGQDDTIQGKATTTQENTTQLITTQQAK